MLTKSVSWRTSTTFGRVCNKIGSIKLAIPVLVVVTGAMIVGTFIESKHDGATARALVYGSGWFIALMVLVCVILVAAVITRYPWRRRHTGFIVVHASLITLIAGGFWSLFERVEGQLWLQEGTSGNILETSRVQIEALNQTNGQLAPGPYALVDSATKSANINGLKLRIVDRWPNTTEHRDVLNDGANPLEAVEILQDPNAPEGLWIGQTLDGQAWPRIQDLQVRVMPLGQTYTPPDAEAVVSTDYTFVVNGERKPVPEVGEELLPGWTVESVRRLKHATVTAEGLVEGVSDHENPAIEVVLNDGKGTLERHVAYKSFPDMKIHRPIQGEADSGVTLEAPAAGGGERLVFESVDGRLRATHVASNGEVEIIPQKGDLPWTLTFGTRSLTIKNHFSNARASTHLVRAPSSDRSRPALVVRIEGGTGEDIPLQWKNPTHVTTPTGTATLRYGPHAVPLPFTIELVDFRKLDYPGTEMAMAYESDVVVTTSQGSDNKVEEHRIYMNNPYKHAGWKVYQSGFDGDSVSVFSIMKDPGLPLTYIGCIGLSIGIFLTFYAGGLSWGHPGIPVPFSQRENSNALQSLSTRGSSDSVGRDRAAVDQGNRLDPDAGQRADDAPGHLRQGSGGEADRSVTLVSEARV
jgi:ResB-like family